jgi:hypothetical protein
MQQADSSENQSRYRALEQADVRDRGIPYLIWAANNLNSLFESYGVKGKDGRGAAPSDIRPETIRHGDQFGSV